MRRRIDAQIKRSNAQVRPARTKQAPQATDGAFVILETYGYPTDDAAGPDGPRRRPGG